MQDPQDFLAHRGIALARRVLRRLDEVGKPLDVMLEVKLSPEEAKHGVDPAALPALIETVKRCANLKLHGLMSR